MVGFPTSSDIYLEADGKKNRGGTELQSESYKKQ